jgi:hypothetical protein
MQRIFRAHLGPGVGQSGTYIILRRAYAYLEEDLRRIGNVTVIVDRRIRERRDAHERVPAERRRAERRSTREELGEMVIVSQGP